MFMSYCGAYAQYDAYIDAPAMTLQQKDLDAFDAAASLSAKFDGNDADAFYDELNGLDDDLVWREDLSTYSIPELISASQILSKVAYASEFGEEFETVLIADGRNIEIATELLGRDLEIWPELDSRVSQVLVWAIYQRLYTFYDLKKYDDARLELADLNWAIQEFDEVSMPEDLSKFRSMADEMSLLLEEASKN